MTLAIFRGQNHPQYSKPCLIPCNVKADRKGLEPDILGQGNEKNEKGCNHPDQHDIVVNRPSWRSTGLVAVLADTGMNGLIGLS